MYKPLVTNFNKKYGNNRWVTYSFKLKREVFLFSDLEYEHWLMVESNPKVINFCEQPLVMTACIHGKLVTSIVDMWVKYEDGNEEFIEIKYSSDLIKQRVINQIFTQKYWCAANGFQHRVRTEGDICVNRILLSNLKVLVKGNKQQTQQIETDIYQVMKILKHNKTQKTTINSLITATQIPSNRLLISIGQMILTGEICSNISKEYFGTNTEVWVNV
ncbi:MULTISPECIES: TnsA endonuclease N-terminal domain-containing protein [Bacillus]|uniref:TnsA endonuclease N-terminal domain-containing protein n=1 Tax=Bacillus fungorum TaxID=2039284 RepID=UPI003396E14A